MKKKLAIALPLTTDREYNQFWDSFIVMEKPTEFTYLRPQFPGYIDDVRNGLVRQAFLGHCSHILFMDTDQTYPVDAIAKMLSLADAGHPIVGTVVYRRYPDYDPLCFRFGDGGLLKVPDKEIFSDEVIEVDATGAGCILFDMEVFKNVPEPWFFDINKRLGKKGPGEDIGFCMKCRQAGYPIVVDTSIKIGHLTLFEIEGKFYRLYSKLKQLHTNKGEEK